MEQLVESSLSVAKIRLWSFRRVETLQKDGAFVQDVIDLIKSIPVQSVVSMFACLHKIFQYEREKQC